MPRPGLNFVEPVGRYCVKPGLKGPTSRGAARPCETPCLRMGRGGHPRTYNVGDVGLWSIPQTRICDGFPTSVGFRMASPLCGCNTPKLLTLRYIEPAEDIAGNISRDALFIIAAGAIYRPPTIPRKLNHERRAGGGFFFRGVY